MNHDQWDIPLVTLIEMATYLMAACSVSCPSALCIYLECFCNVGIKNLTAQKMLSLAPPRYVWIQSPCSFYGSVIFGFPPHSSTNFSCVLFGFQSIRPHWPFDIITCTREKEISRTLENWLIEIWADMHTKGSHPYWSGIYAGQVTIWILAHSLNTMFPVGPPTHLKVIFPVLTCIIRMEDTSWQNPNWFPITRMEILWNGGPSGRPWNDSSPVLAKIVNQNTPQEELHQLSET